MPLRPGRRDRTTARSGQGATCTGVQRPTGDIANQAHEVTTAPRPTPRVPAARAATRWRRREDEQRGGATRTGAPRWPEDHVGDARTPREGAGPAGGADERAGAALGPRGAAGPSGHERDHGGGPADDAMAPRLAAPCRSRPSPRRCRPGRRATSPSTLRGTRSVRAAPGHQRNDRPGGEQDGGDPAQGLAQRPAGMEHAHEQAEGQAAPAETGGGAHPPSPVSGRSGSNRGPRRRPDSGGAGVGHAQPRLHQA